MEAAVVPGVLLAILLLTGIVGNRSKPPGIQLLVGVWNELSDRTLQVSTPYCYGVTAQSVVVFVAKMGISAAGDQGHAGQSYGDSRPGDLLEPFIVLQVAMGALI